MSLAHLPSSTASYHRIFSTVNLAANRVSAQLRRAYIESVVHQDAEFFDEVGGGEVGTRLMKDVTVVRTALGEKLAFMLWG